MENFDLKNKSKGILVFLEIEDGRLCDVSLEVLSQACQMAETYAFLPETEAEAKTFLKALQGCRIHTLYCSAYPVWNQEELQIRMMEECIKACRPSIVLAGSTYLGRRMGAQLAVAFGTGVTADCTSLRLMDGENLMQTRPAFGGYVMADIITPDKRPQIATIRPGIYEKPEAGGGAPLFIRQLPGNRDSITVLESVVERIELEREKSLLEHKIVIALGRGIKKKEDIEIFRELAGRMGAGLGCSRALVEKGWMPPECQIGLSGNHVRPQVMVTFGISGSTQFLTGMRHSKKIIAVNSDIHAAIFEIAHTPVCADLYETAQGLLNMF